MATHLAPALDSIEGFRVVQVDSRTPERAETLASELREATAVTDPNEVLPTADIYIVSLVDDAVGSLSGLLPSNEALWLHTSGSLPKEILASRSDRYGVLYPLQTFSRDVDVNIGEIPFFIEGSSADVEKEIKELAEKVTSRVFHADEEKRRRMHIAAVFACNFANHLWTIADDILHDEGLTLEVLHPLLCETLRKAIAASPAAGQTGPAVRGDRNVMDRHISLLSPERAEIYRLMSDSIYDYHHKG